MDRRRVGQTSCMCTRISRKQTAPASRLTVQCYTERPGITMARQGTGHDTVMNGHESTKNFRKPAPRTDLQQSLLSVHRTIRKRITPEMF